MSSDTGEAPAEAPEPEEPVAPDPRPAPAAPAPPPAEPEFDDEPPGSYLRELGVRGWNVAVASVTLAATIVVGALGRAGSVPEEWLPPARVVWLFLPLIAATTFIITLWQHLSSFTPRVPGKARSALIISFVAVVIWAVLRAY